MKKQGKENLGLLSAKKRNTVKFISLHNNWCDQTDTQITVILNQVIPQQ